MTRLLRAVLDGLGKRSSAVRLRAGTARPDAFDGLRTRRLRLQGSQRSGDLRARAHHAKRAPRQSGAYRAQPAGVCLTARGGWSVAIWRLLDRVERDWGKRPRKASGSHERVDRPGSVRSMRWPALPAWLRKPCHAKGGRPIRPRPPHRTRLSPRPQSDTTVEPVRRGRTREPRSCCKAPTA